jgi:hypothetical protein
MKRNILKLASLCFLAFTFNSSAADLFVDLNSANPITPYADWSTAATNIQDAVDAANPGDRIFVTNGIYRTGGRIVSGPTTNRVAVDKAVIVQSVNGPAVTVIEGRQVPGITNGAGAVRCVRLADGAVLAGFTLTNGATYTDSGGGVSCASASAIVSNCVLAGNSARSDGGGGYLGTFNNCLFAGNTAFFNGGGASGGILNNCVLTGNSAVSAGGGVYYPQTVNNCTVVGNRTGAEGGGIYGGTLNNSIIYYNAANSGPNAFNTTLANNCCTTPLPAGSGNITNEPVFVDLAGGNLRPQPNSLCLNAGSNALAAAGPDLDGNPRIVGGTVDLGAYEFQSPVRYVNINNPTPVSPFTNWITAAIKIQDAIDAANAGDFIIVSNGVYKTGGRLVHGALTNRVVVDKAVTVQSVNGPNVTNYLVAGGHTNWLVRQATVIQGNATVGNSAVRGVYLTNGAALIGFLVTNGATRSSGDTVFEQSGGGVWCESSNAVVAHCLIQGNSAGLNSGFGGGVFGGTLNNCTVAGNAARSGSGTCSNTVRDCTIVGNSGDGAFAANLFNCLIASNQTGAASATLSNCTLWANGIYSSGGGAYRCTLFNCVLLTNYPGFYPGGAYYGGGAYGSELHNCLLRGNRSGSFGGGTYQCTNFNCTFEGNSAGSYGGGLSGGISYNCLVAGNTANFGGGAYQATLYNCTAVGNTATNDGGGVYGGNLYNCIVYFNTALSGLNWSNVATSFYSCTTPTPPGSSNITNPPSFVDAAFGDYRLRCGSPGINAGNNSYVTVTNDLEGRPRIVDGTVDMGACEFNPVMDLVPRIRKNFSFDNFAASYPVPFAAQIGGCPDCFWWDFGDGATVTNQTSVSHAWTSPGTYNVVLMAYSASLGYGLSATTRVSVVQQPVYYVNVNTSTPVAPFTNWATAARYIQQSIGAGNTPGRLVLVTNGSYLGALYMGGTLWKSVTLTNNVVVQSVNGPVTTIIDNNNFYQAVYVGDDSILSGFTVTGGSALSGTNLYRDLCGGGIWCEPKGMATNCTITGNTAGYGGGGVYQGIFYNCVFSNNTVNSTAGGSGGGGAYGGTFYHCYFVSNTVYGYADDLSTGGGAARQSTLYDSCIASNRTLVNGRGGGCLASVLSNCVVACNETEYHGGGAADSTLYHCFVRGNAATTSGGGGGASCTFWNCVLMENRAQSGGGGAGWSTLHNCLVVSNQAVSYGGGLYNGSNCYNCTVVKNTAARGGGVDGVAYPCLIYNSIILGNTASNGSNNWEGLVQSRNSCSIPKLPPTGLTYGNITSDPVFVDAAFHLSAGSPCRGTGSSLYAGGTDLDGEVWNSPPSMGADEVYDADFMGALSVAIQAGQTNPLVNRSLGLVGQVAGRAARLDWSFGDGTIVTNSNFFTSHVWTSPGDYSVVFTAYNTDNPAGVSTNVWIHVEPLEPPVLQFTSFSLSPVNGFQFQFVGQPTAFYTVQNATNLAPPIAWQNLQTIISTGGVVRVKDTNATRGTSFYRVGVQ